jgi:hypothetical protein
MRSEKEIKELLFKMTPDTPYKYGIHLALKWVLEELTTEGLR